MMLLCSKPFQFHCNDDCKKNWLGGNCREPARHGGAELPPEEERVVYMMENQVAYSLDKVDICVHCRVSTSCYEL